MDRLDKYLCDCGVGTRSVVKNIIKAGRITVDGKTEKDPGRKVGPDSHICMDGETLGKRGLLVVMTAPGCWTKFSPSGLRLKWCSCS